MQRTKIKKFIDNYEKLIMTWRYVDRRITYLNVAKRISG